MKIIVIILLRQWNRLKTIKTTVFLLKYMFFVGQRVDFEHRKIVENLCQSERLSEFFWELLGMIGNI